MWNLVQASYHYRWPYPESPIYLFYFFIELILKGASVTNPFRICTEGFKQPSHYFPLLVFGSWL